MCAALLRVPRVQAVLSALSLMTASAAGQEGQAGVHWIFPPASGDTMTFHHNDTINVTYTSSFSTPIMYTFCQGEHVDQVDILNVPGNNASVMIKLDWDHDDAKCWFDIKPDSDGGQGSNSNGFFYASEEDTRATVGLSSTSSTATATSTTSTNTAATTTDGSAATRTNIPATTTATSAGAASTNSSDASSSGLSVGAQAGIGVGAGLAGIAIGGLAIFIFMRRRKQAAVANNDNNADPSIGPSMGQSYYDPKLPAQLSSHPVYSDQASSAYQSRSYTTSPDNTFEGAAPTGASPTHYTQNYTPVPQEMDAQHMQIQELPATRHV
ncbi:hypothetical protein G7054_g13021 [Neopestalotiopsis clavispora]|nr:hypothetical protein G7054_g13021 [Neopestalotiopsis clavispora]